jgi:hypothetical protein
MARPKKPKSQLRFPLVVDVPADFDGTPADLLRGIHPDLDAFLNLGERFARQNLDYGADAADTVVTDDSPRFFLGHGATLLADGDLDTVLRAHQAVREGGNRNPLNVCYDSKGYYLFALHHTPVDAA